MKNVILLLAIFSLAACSSPEERAQREAQKEIDVCTRSGFQPDTPAFEECRLEVKSREEQRAADRLSAIDDMRTDNRTGNSLPSGATIPLP